MQLDTTPLSPQKWGKQKNIGYRTIYNACATGALRHIRIGTRKILILPEAMDAWLKSLETGGDQK